MNNSKNSTNLLQEKLFNGYFYSSNELTIKHTQGNNILPELADLIKKQKSTLPNEEATEHFFKAEEAFFNNQFKSALKHYLSATKVPLYRAYCYRTSAYIARKQGNTVQSKGFAKKALKVNPKDYLSLKILSELLPPNNQNPEVQHIKEQLNKIKNYYDSSSNTSTFSESLEPSQTHTAIGLDNSEIEELTDLFRVDSETPESFENTSESKTLHEEESSSQIINHFKNPELFKNKERIHNTPSTNMELEMHKEQIVTQKTEELDSNLSETSSLSNKDSNTNSLETENRHSMAYQELKELAASNFSVKKQSTNEFINSQLGFDMSNEQTLGQRIQSFRSEQTKLISDYVNATKMHSKKLTNALYVLHGWNNTFQEEARGLNESTSFSSQLLLDQTKNTSGGYFISWNGKGVVINPGENFLENFHKEGLHIKDIDYVIVTKANQEAYSDLKAIYELNYRLNSTNNSLHIIQYYLNQQAHRTIGPLLKPNFKQERNTIHCLELYLDSPDIETVSLNETMTLQYFPTITRETSSHTSARNQAISSSPLSCLGIKLELSSPETQSIEKVIGYVSGSAWSPLLSQHLSKCDVLISGFENTNSDDYNKLKYNIDSLGFFGTASLIEDAAPKLLICSEFGGQEGDIRLEVSKKFRQENAFGKQKGTVVLPGDIGCTVDLKKSMLLCSVNKTLIDPSQVRVVKNQDSFGKLQYLSPNCFL